MKKLLVALLAVFTISTSYISADKVKFSINNSHKDTLAAPAKMQFAEIASTKEISFSKQLFEHINFENVNPLSYDVFDKAIKGFNNLKKAGKIPENTKFLTVCDFSLSSNVKRLWVINVEDKKVVFNSLVAHGKNTGEEFAEHFSNTENSLQSSLGFYVTEDTYNGENGYSLKLEGMDKGFNDNALSRSIVMHGADYVNEEFAAQHHRIGRSWGCPAVPRSLAEPIINTIKGKNVLFIFYPDQNYLQSSQWLKS